MNNLQGLSVVKTLIVLSCAHLWVSRASCICVAFMIRLQTHGRVAHANNHGGEHNILLCDCSQVIFKIQDIAAEHRSLVQPKPLPLGRQGGPKTYYFQQGSLTHFFQACLSSPLEHCRPSHLSGTHTVQTICGRLSLSSCFTCPSHGRTLRGGGTTCCSDSSWLAQYAAEYSAHVSGPQFGANY